MWRGAARERSHRQSSAQPTVDVFKPGFKTPRSEITPCRRVLNTPMMSRKEGLCPAVESGALRRVVQPGRRARTCPITVFWCCRGIHQLAEGR